MPVKSAVANKLTCVVCLHRLMSKNTQAEPGRSYSLRNVGNPKKNRTEGLRLLIYNVP